MRDPCPGGVPPTLPDQINLVCVVDEPQQLNRSAIQNGGYRLSSGTQRKLQSVTGARWLRTPDRRIGTFIVRLDGANRRGQIRQLCTVIAGARFCG